MMKTYNIVNNGSQVEEIFYTRKNNLIYLDK